MTGQGADRIPGDPEQVQRLADEWHRASSKISAAAEELRGVSPEGVWSGGSAESFSTKVTSLVAQWKAAAAALEDGSAQLSAFAAVLAWARREAEAAAALSSAADQRSADARAAWQKDKAAAAAQPGIPSGRAVVIEPVFTDPGAADRAAAEQRLADAQAAVQEAGDRTSAHLDGSMDWPQAAVAAGTLLKPRPGDVVTAPTGGAVTPAAALETDADPDAAAAALRAAQARAAKGLGADAAGGDGLGLLGVAAIAGGTVVAGAGVVAGARLAGLSGLTGASGASSGGGMLGAVPPRTAGMTGGGEGAGAGRRGSKLQPTGSTAYVMGLDSTAAGDDDPVEEDRR